MPERTPLTINEKKMVFSVYSYLKDFYSSPSRRRASTLRKEVATACGIGDGWTHMFQNNVGDILWDLRINSLGQSHRSKSYMLSLYDLGLWLDYTRPWPMTVHSSDQGESQYFARTLAHEDLLCRDTALCELCVPHNVPLLSALQQILCQMVPVRLTKCTLLPRISFLLRKEKTFVIVCQECNLYTSSPLVLLSL
jgi:hypothetical protein